MNGGDPRALADRVIGNPVLARRAKIRMEAISAVTIDVVDDRVRVCRHWALRDVLVPGALVGQRLAIWRNISGWKDLAATERRIGVNRLRWNDSSDDQGQSDKDSPADNSH